VKRVVILAGAVAVLAGCGSQAAPPKQAEPPRLPRALAQAWAQEANAIAASLAANDGCAAQVSVLALQEEVVAAVNAHRIPKLLLEPLSSGVNDLVAQITCAPPLAPTDQGNGNDKKKHGHKNEGGD
jgi:Prokaryotic membrane lipoprotein lipid attachment site